MASPFWRNDPAYRSDRCPLYPLPLIAQLETDRDEGRGLRLRSWGRAGCWMGRLAWLSRERRSRRAAFSRSSASVLFGVFAPP